MKTHQDLRFENMGLCGSSLQQGVDETGGLKVDGWLMGRKIGKGATGKVFLAKNEKTGKDFDAEEVFSLPRQTLHEQMQVN